MARRSAEDAERSRDAILRAARQAFASKGFAGASTAEIVRAAGLTEGALFHHFASKKALFAEVLHVLEGELTAHAVQSGLKGPPFEAFLEACRRSLQYAQRPDYQKIVMVDGPNVLGDSDWRRVDSGFGLSAIRAGLRRMSATPATDKDVRVLAVAILGILNEASFALARSERGVSVDATVALVERLLCASLKL